jgi:calcium-dependent protein kinase
MYRYCAGGELFHYIIDKKHLDEAEAAKIMKQLFSALLYLHEHSISHRYNNYSVSFKLLIET